MNHDLIAERLIDVFGLQSPPVALTFVDQPPSDVAVHFQARPSACSFWRDAERETFYASAEAHFNCPLGAVVMGFTLPEGTHRRLSDLVMLMCDGSYLDMTEAGEVPSMAGPRDGIVYGPLAQHPITADLVLIWLRAHQAMLYNEAAAAAEWSTATSVITGRPACAALPLASADAVPTMSFGCTGMRTFTGIADDRILGVVPGPRLETFIDAAEAIREANLSMGLYYQQHQAHIASLATGG